MLCYYASKLEAAKHNLQKTWKVINTIILRKKAETGIPSVIQNMQDYIAVNGKPRELYIMLCDENASLPLI